jgi:hypothetical protein
VEDFVEEDAEGPDICFVRVVGFGEGFGGHEGQ